MQPSSSRICLFALVVFTSLVTGRSGSADPVLELHKGDHVCLIGNALADRMQHHGWLETLLQARFPGKKLVLRNLGFSGDELDRRPRSANFGSPDDHLHHSQADVILAFFGYNESFAAEAGLDAFRARLGAFIDHTLSQRYNGESAPRLVLFSPIAHEGLDDPNLPGGSENRRRLSLYTKAMAEVAVEKNILFVNLFDPSLDLYRKSALPLTINGVHLNETGNRRLAEVIDATLFGEALEHDEATLQQIRGAVLDKNLHWFNRYRATDGYSQYGGRSGLRFVDGQTNFVVMQRELEMLDVMTANRDRRIWSVARGHDLVVYDDNIPEPLVVKTNRPGPGPDGEHVFLGGEEAIEKLTIGEGLDVNLFASEERFPQLVNPVQCAVDTDSRLWVAAWLTYPHWNPRRPLDDKLLILPDEDRDGRADRCIVFADGLHNPTGFEFWGGGVLVAQAPDIVFLQDTDGDDRADRLTRVVNGIDSADTHHTANSFVIGPDGWLYFQRGVFHVMNVETPWGPAFRSTTSAVYRFNPRTFEFEHHFNVGPNPHGDTFDAWGYQFVSDGTSGTGYYVGFPGRGTPHQLYVKRVRPVPAIGLVGSEHFPERNRGNLLICNAIGFLGVAQLRFVHEGADIRAEEIEPILYSADPNFRPSDVEIGGDGALYVLDWHNPLIGHMQHNLRDPSRDHEHGRVYRVTARGRPLLEPVKLRGRSIPEVLELLDSPTLAVRYRARLELSGRDSQEVVKETRRWASRFDAARAEHARPLLEALWIHQQHRVVNLGLLHRVLGAAEPLARAAATRVLRDWIDDVPDAGSLLVKLAGDEHPGVRAEAVVASAWYEGPDAAEVIFEAQRWPTDVHLDFVLAEARKSVDLDGYTSRRLAEGKPLSPAAQAHVLRNASVADLLKLERSEAVYRAILSREGVEVAHLREAIAGLAKIKGKSEPEVLLAVVEDLEARERPASFAGLAEILAGHAGGNLKDLRGQLVRLARRGKTSDTRRMGYAAWVASDRSVAEALAAASRKKASLRDFLESLSLLAPEKVPADAYEEVRPLLFELPKGLREETASSSLEEAGIRVEYFQPHPPNVRLESFAGRKPTASGIVPEIKIDVPQLKRRDQFALRFTGLLRVDQAGSYTFYTNSDDGSRLYVGNEEVVNNDGLHGMSEKRGSIHLAPGAHPIVVTYFDNGGGDGLVVSWEGPGFEKQPIPAARLAVQGAETTQDVAIRALEAIPGHESRKFEDLAQVVHRGRSQTSAVGVLGSIPESEWPAEAIRPLATDLARYVSEIPARYRTSRSALDAMRLADRLAAKLPAEEARELQARLADLEVQIIRIGTVPQRMIFDKERLAVQAGKTVEFVFSNTDEMPHNFAVTEPGALEEVGLLGEATAQEPDVTERNYIPKTDKILVASRLLQPGETQALSFDVPVEPGIYPYVCTYPGHWRRMYGALYVVADLKAYLANPEEYLAAHPLPLRDELLKYNTREKQWALEDLAPSLAQLHDGRNFQVGKSLFEAAACVSCHRLNDVGQEIGPDLSQLDEEKRKPESILQNILDPSAVVDEKYRSSVFILVTGQTVNGMVVEETAKEVKVAVDPLAKAEPTVIPKNRILRRSESATSIMPQGLLDKFSREEILDLIGYVHSGGNEKHHLYSEAHEH